MMLQKIKVNKDQEDKSSIKVPIGLRLIECRAKAKLLSLTFQQLDEMQQQGNKDIESLIASAKSQQQSKHGPKNNTEKEQDVISETSSGTTHLRPTSPQTSQSHFASTSITLFSPTSQPRAVKSSPMPQLQEADATSNQLQEETTAKKRITKSFCVAGCSSNNHNDTLIRVIAKQKPLPKDASNASKITYNKKLERRYAQLTKCDLSRYDKRNNLRYCATHENSDSDEEDDLILCQLVNCTSRDSLLTATLLSPSPPQQQNITTHSTLSSSDQSQQSHWVHPTRHQLRLSQDAKCLVTKT